jgi:putative transposase
MIKAIKVRIYPNKEQQDYISNLIGCSRFVYNNLLAYKIEEYNTNKHNVTFGELGKKLTNLKTSYTFLNNVHSKVLQQSIITLLDAYKRFFKNGNGFPNFKSKKDNKQSCRFPVDAIGKINGNRITLIRKLSDIHYKCSRRDEIYLNKYSNNIKSATLSKTKSGKYFLSILVDLCVVNKELEKTDKIVGIDLGIKDFIVTSDGSKFENLKTIRNNQRKITKLQRKLSKKQNGSKNKEKTRIKLAKYHEKLKNIKTNYLHEVSNKIINENQVIVMEDLNVSGMMKNHNLAKSIQELSLYNFKTILQYKANWYGRDIIEVDRYFPSTKLCSCCGYKNNSLTLNDREWECPECKVVHDRDFNSSINIENEGRRILNIKEKIGLSSPESKPLENTTLVGSLKKENNV